jgi:spermidine synthase
MRRQPSEEVMESMPSGQDASLPKWGTGIVGMRWYFVFFLASGFCSLVYEVVWLRLAMAEFGVTTPMVSIVLSMFMAGMGLGSWGVGRFIRRFQEAPASTALRLYALAELLIGVSGLVVPHMLAYGHYVLLGTTHGVAWQSTVYYLLSGAWVALSLIPWCFCMGATYPFAMAAIRKSFGAEGERSFSYLYLANVVGAVLGTIISAFFLVELLGFRGTLRLTSTINGILAGIVFLLSLSPALSLRPITTASDRKAPRRLYGLPANLLLVLLFLTGLISVGMEVVWIRQFTPYLGNVVYTFAIILAIYLVATSCGSVAYRWWVRSHKPLEGSSAWIIAGLLALIPLLAADSKLPIPRPAQEAGFVLGAIRALIGIGPFSALLGFLTPMMIDHWSSGDPDRAGSAYSINVLGSILGPLLTGFWLLSWMGERWALVFLAAPLFFIGLIADLWRRPAVEDAHPAGFPIVRYSAVLLFSVPLVGLTHDYENQWPEGVMRRDYTATVVATGKGMDKHLLVNGIGMTQLTPITKMMAHLPLAFLDRAPEKALVVCFGMGTTFRSMRSWGIRATAVDLVPSVPAVFGYFHSDGPEIVRSPLAEIVIDDGRRFLEGSTERYDVITLDPPPPIGAPTSSLLYSREFYEIAKTHLQPDGVMQVWLPGGDAATQASIAKALQEAFPYVRAFQSIEGWGLHFLASLQPLTIVRGSVLASRLPRSAALDLVEWGPKLTAVDQFEAVLRREVPLNSLIAKAPRVPALRDNEPINEYFFLRSKFHYYR